MAMLQKPEVVMRSSNSDLRSHIATEYFENYIPVYVGPVPQRILSPRMVLRFVGDLSLAELELCATSGTFSSFTVVTYRDRIQELDSLVIQEFLQKENQVGIPEFEVRNLPAPTGRLQNIYDFYLNISISLGGDSVRINLMEPEGELDGKIKMSESCLLGLDERKRLSCIWLFQLDERQRERFEDMSRDYDERHQRNTGWANKISSMFGR